MGLFRMIPEKGKNYFVEYESGNKQSVGALRTTPLPDLKKNPFSLQAAWINGKLLISVNKENGAVLPKMHLLVHCRGDMLYFNTWNEKKNVLPLEKDFLRSGVNHLILLSEDYHPLSERLVFCNKNDHIQPEIKADRQTYKSREHVVMDISLDKATGFNSEDSIIHDKNGTVYIDLPEVVIKGKRIKKKTKNNLKPDLAISVTADNEVQIDTMTNILTEILLESELKGTVSNPAYYFSNAVEADADADAWMDEIRHSKSHAGRMGYSGD
jgi:hypothetical protein